MNMNRFFYYCFIFSTTICSNEVNDPFENINRNFEFNENLDEKILKPTAKFIQISTRIKKVYKFF